LVKGEKNDEIDRGGEKSVCRLKYWGEKDEEIEKGVSPLKDNSSQRKGMLGKKKKVNVLGGGQKTQFPRKRDQLNPGRGWGTGRQTSH